jgi:ubiquinone/menaquinone biosynthesis C-methylase UbiE
MARRPHDDQIVAEFTRQARRFAAHPSLAEADGIARMFAAAASGGNGRILDVACGPGIVACAAAQRAVQVTGIDLTPAMIDQARLRQQALGLANVDWLIGDARALPFAAASFDVVLTRYSFHHLPDPETVLAEMARVCRPGGRIVVADVTPSARCQPAYDAMERLRDPSHVSARTLAQLRRLGQDLGLTEVTCDGYRLEVALAAVTDRHTLPQLTALFDADIAGGTDAIGVGARRADDGIRFYFPVSIMAWELGCR